MSTTNSTETPAQTTARTAVPPKDWKYAFEPGNSTIEDVALRADALKLSLPILMDFDYAREQFNGGELPEWAHTFELHANGVDGEGGGPEIFLDGEYGRVELGAAVVYGRYCGSTSRGIVVQIDGNDFGYMTPDEMRALAKNLRSAANAIDRSES